MFIVEILTRSGRVCEQHATYEDARRRVEQFPAESLLSCPLIFQDLVDGSQRLVCEDGKPLQFHRLPWDEAPAPEDSPLPLADMTEDATPAGDFGDRLP